ERERVVRSLRRQAFRLAAYDRLRNEERRLRLARLRGEYGKARAAEQTAGQEARSKELQAAELGEQIRRVEAELACRQQQYLRSLEERQTLHAEQQQLQNELSRQETAQAVAQGNAQQLAQQQAELAQEATELERTIAQTEKECAELKAIQEARSAKLAQLDVALESSRSRAGASEARLLELRQALVAGQKRVAELFEERLELRQAQLMAEAKAKNQEELRTESVRELEANQSALDELKSQAGVIGASLQAHKSELESVRSVLCARRNEIRNLQARREELTKEALQLGHKLSEVNKEVSALQAALGSKQRDVAREHLGENFRGILGDFLEAQPEHEAMVEVALTGLLEAVVISGADSDRPSEPFSSALSVLGREARWVIVRAGPSQPASASESDDSLLRYVRLRPGTPSSVCTQLQRCRIAATLSEAWSRHQATPEDIFVTPDGIGVFPGDIVVALPSRGGQLAAARRLAELEQTASLLSSRLAAVAAEIEAIDEQLAELARQIEAHEGAVMEQTTDVYRTQAELDSLGRRRADLEQDRRRLRQQETRYTSSVQELTQEAARLAEQAGRLEAQEQEEMKRNQELASAISELEQDIKKALAQGSEILLDLTRARAEVETGESELELRTRERNRLTERATAIAQRRAAIVREIETCQGSVAQCENEISRLRARLAAVEQRLTRLDHTRFPNTAELEKQLAALRPRLEEASGQVMEARLQVLEAEHRRSQLEQEAKQVYNVDLASSDTSEVTGPETTEPELSEKLQTITARLERLGRVNPLAGDEYEKERAELERLKSQRADILQANAWPLGIIE
ncbi:MAG: hypothetical protein ABIK62_08140, partial [candidate division WOR-3 bacterium]